MAVQKYIYPSVSKVHAGSFCVSVIHQTLTWTTGSLTCVQDHSYACIYTGGWAHQQRVRFLTRGGEKLTSFFCIVVMFVVQGVRRRIHWRQAPLRTDRYNNGF